MRRILLIAAAAILLWGAAIAGLWVQVSANADRFVLAGATTLTVVAVLSEALRRLHDDDRRQLLRTIADLTTPRDLHATRPLRRVR